MFLKDIKDFGLKTMPMRVGRIELPSHPWQGRVLPLNHTRNAPGGIRTPNNGSEDRRDIHFTTRANFSLFSLANQFD